MNKFRLTVKLLVTATFLLAFASLAQAQATRTWVSGVGDDVNPCSRTAPCKTYAGAISKTANGGEISTLDPGGFGAVSITKNITIEGTKGQGYGSILASSVNGVTINDSLSGAPNTVVVNLRNLAINGAGGNVAPFVTGLSGVNFISGKSVNIEDCQIYNFTTAGVRVAVTAGSITHELHMRNTTIWNTAIGVTLSSTGASSSISLQMDNCSIRHGLSSTSDGIVLGANSAAIVRGSYFAFLDRAVDVSAGFGANLIDCTLASNTTAITVATATSRITHSSVIGNGTGVNFTGGVLQSFGDNVYSGNTNNFTGGAITPQGQQ